MCGENIAAEEEKDTMLPVKAAFFVYGHSSSVILLYITQNTRVYDISKFRVEYITNAFVCTDRRNRRLRWCRTVMSASSASEEIEPKTV